MDEQYFKEVIQPLLDHPLVRFVGEIADQDKDEFLGNALALRAPINWPEPFGIALIEAMACGTPVIAFARGRCRKSSIIANLVSLFRRRKKPSQQ